MHLDFTSRTPRRNPSHRYSDQNPPAQMPRPRHRRAPATLGGPAAILGVSIATLASVVLNGALLVHLLSRPRAAQPAAAAACQVVYTPAQSVLQYKPVTWHPLSGGPQTIYDQEPSEEVDAAWRELYKNPISTIPRTQAKLLPNRTISVEGEPGYYFTALEVFHELHCLDSLRKAVNPEHYPPGHQHRAAADGAPAPDADADTGRAHVAHCLSALRQALVCAADVTPTVWQWSAEAGVAAHRDDVPHSCRDVAAIRGWAEEHRARREVDANHRVPDSGDD